MANSEWIEKALEELLYIPKTNDKTNDFVRFKSRKTIPDLKKVIRKMLLKTKGLTTWQIEAYLGISKRLAQKYTKLLCELRWLIIGKWVTYNDLNPFLELIAGYYLKETCQICSKFVPYQVDFLDLFAYPLWLALNEKVLDVEIIWSQHEPNFSKQYFPNPTYHFRKIYPYWNGIVQFKIETDKKTHYAVLPYNIHWTGRNPHITLPIRHKLYGIKEVSFVKRGLKVHFDNSITVGIPLGCASWVSRKLQHQWGMSHWSDIVARFLKKYWENEYVECWDFETHEQILRERLIDKKWLKDELKNRDLIIKQFLA